MPDYKLKCAKCGCQFQRYSFYPLSEDERQCPCCGSDKTRETSVVYYEMEDVSQYGFC